MDASSEPNPSEVLRWMEVPGQPNVFALGNFARQVTFASQQTRAFNLIWALFSTNRLAAGQHVAVVGAGLAGMTAAVAALARGCKVDLYEQASQPCPLQRGNDIRFIHPNILSWPDEGSYKAQTDFPFLNWTAATVRGVIKQIDLQWNRLADNNPLLSRYFGFKVSRLYASSSKSGPRRPSLSANRIVELVANGDGQAGEGKKKDEKKKKDRVSAGYVECAYDSIILAVGFGEERTVTGVPFTSYWENDSLHQENSRGRRSILVSGCGDGGLIDALRLRLRNFDHAQFVRDFLNVGGSGALVQELKKVDDELLRYAGSPDISLKFQDRYDEIDVPENIERHFREGKRGDTTVTLNSPAPGPLSYRASLLNRYATYLAMRFADLHYLSGRIVAERAGDGNFQITLEQDGTGLRESKLFDLVIVRHGPQSVIRQLIPAPALAELEDWWQKNQDITTRPHWYDPDEKRRHRFWGIESKTAPRPEEVIDLALTTFDSAYRELRRDDPEVQSVAVGEVDGRCGFFVTLKPGAATRSSRLYADVPVYYVAPYDMPVPPTEPEPAAPHKGAPAPRLVQVGAGIYNYDARERLTRRPAGAGAQQEAPAAPEARPETQGVSPAGAGTLGCFAMDEEGHQYLLTTSNVLLVEGVSRKGDRIFLEGQGPTTQHQPIATLADFKDISRKDDGQSAETVSRVDVAAALLEQGVQPDFSQPPAPWQIKGVGPAAVGDKVAKLGRTSGLTTGEVVEVNVTFPVITSSSGNVWLSGTVIVGAEKQEFSMAGDGGAAIVRDDGTAIGLLSAGSPGGQDRPGLTLACSLEDALRDLKLQLLMPERLKEGSSKKPHGRRGKQKADGATDGAGS